MTAERFYLSNENKASQWPKLRDAISSFIGTGVWVSVTEKKPKRHDIQNSLAHVWKRDASKHHGEELDEVWGRWKLDHLLSIKVAHPETYHEAMREANKIRAVVAHLAEVRRQQIGPNFDISEWGFDVRRISNRQLEIDAAFDICRSNELGVAMFAEWLSTIQRTEAEAGCILVASKKQLDEAIMREADARVAA